VEWVKLKDIYKQLQKKQMSQIKEAMKGKKDVKKRVKQDTTTAGHNADERPVSKSHDPVSISHDPSMPTCDSGLTVEITMCTLPSSDLEVCYCTAC